jgi:hypothetical protein
MWGDIVPLDAAGRIEIVRQVVRLFLLLQSKNLVVGDMSMRNLLWSASPIGIYLLDCDNICQIGLPPVMPQPQTPDWEDPFQPPDGPDLETDRYKLALIVARVLSQTPTSRPGESLNFVRGLPDRLITEMSARLAEVGGPPETRPDAAQWMSTLENDLGMYGIRHYSMVTNDEEAR